MDKTALAIREVANAAADINLTAQLIPAQSRWNIELLLAQINEMETVANTHSNLTILAQAAHQLPKQIRTEIAALLIEADTRQTNLQATLQQMHQTVTAARDSLPLLQETLDRTAATGTELTRAVQALDHFWSRWDKPENMPVAEDRQFNISEWTHAADTFRRAAAELHGGIEELNRTVAGQNGSSLVDVTTSRLQSIITHATICILIVIGATFAVMIVVRVFFSQREKLSS